MDVFKAGKGQVMSTGFYDGVAAHMRLLERAGGYGNNLETDGSGNMGIVPTEQTALIYRLEALVRSLRSDYLLGDQNVVRRINDVLEAVERWRGENE